MTEIGHPQVIRADTLLTETVDRLLAERCPPEVAHAAEVSGKADVELWKHLSATGLTTIGSEPGREDGGIIDAITVLRGCGAHAAPVPIAEHGILASWLAQRAGAELPGEMCTVPVADPADRLQIADGVVTGGLLRVPYAGSSTHVAVAVADPSGREWLAITATEQLGIDSSRNLAGEPRDIVDVNGGSTIAALPAGTVGALQRRGVLSRVALMSGAMSRAVQLTATYAHDRKQFGRPLAAFQAVQHLLALAAEHATNAETACWVAADALAADETDPYRRVDVARAVTHEAMEVVSRHCHQAFGAIGVTKEHELHLHTRRLWAWDLEWGTPVDGAGALTGWLAGIDPGARWGALTAVGTAS